jgi:hypothetical protein
MLDCNFVIQELNTLIANHVQGNQAATVETYSYVIKLIQQYFAEFRQQYSEEEEPSLSTCYLAKYLDEHRFFKGTYRCNYATPDEFLEMIEYDLGFC